MKRICSFLLLFAALLSIMPGSNAWAQGTVTSQDKLLSAGELDQLVAPIALYPDPLVSEILMASTYPLEVVEAARWVESNKSLKGDALKQAADQQRWDDSVKSLAATPDVLTTMSSKLDWTQKLGDAVLAQQADVMDAIQRLRSKADANGKLQTTTQQTVKKTRESNREYIVIEPAQSDVVYVPYYDPAVVYGAWSYPAYPPYYFGYPGYIAGGVIATGLAFGAGFAIGAWATHDHWWGGSFGWGNNNINFNRQINVNNINNNNWRHNPDHRHGVNYNNANVAKQFSKGGNANRNFDFRGKDGKQVLNPNNRGKGGEARNLSGQTKKSGKSTKAGGGGKKAGSGSHQRRDAGRHAGSRPNINRGGGGGHVGRSGGGIHRGGGGARRGGGHRRRHNGSYQQPKPQQQKEQQKQ